MYQSIKDELEKRAKDTLSDAERSIIVSRFVDNYDFNNDASNHKSAGGWAMMIEAEILQNHY